MSLNFFRRLAAIAGLGALVTVGSPMARAQALNVLPVTIQMAPGQRAGAMTVYNQSTAETSFQVRAYLWSQPSDGAEPLTASDEISVSPPLGTLAPGASQVIRLVLRHPAQDRESSYRLLLDQIPGPAEPETVRIALRLSLPIFAQPMVRTAAYLRFHVERQDGKSYLAAINDGTRHEKVEEIVIKTANGLSINAVGNVSPYVLAGAKSRWQLTSELPSDDEQLFLTAKTEAAKILNQPIAVTSDH